MAFFHSSITYVSFEMSGWMGSRCYYERDEHYRVFMELPRNLLCMMAAYSISERLCRYAGRPSSACGKTVLSLGLGRASGKDDRAFPLQPANPHSASTTTTPGYCDWWRVVSRWIPCAAKGTTRLYMAVLRCKGNRGRLNERQWQPLRGVEFTQAERKKNERAMTGTWREQASTSLSILSWRKSCVSGNIAERNVEMCVC